MILPDLQGESLWFPNAVAAAPWTLPSHATLLTGLYPWEHGCHSQRTNSLSPSIESIAEVLRDAGYRTGLFSSNTLLDEAGGFTRGFDAAAWGTWHETVLLVPRRSPPHHSNGGQTSPSNGSGKVRWLSRGLAPTVATRFPAFSAAANQLMWKVRSGASLEEPRTSPWIEPTFDAWLGSIEPERPAFAMINLGDAHEPYFAPRETGLRDRLRMSSIPQDSLTHMQGRRALRGEELEMLKAGYLRSLSTLERRTRNLIDILKRRNRFENTCLIVTGDHGQAFGEEGQVLHILRGPVESLLRVPLLLRLPQGVRGGSVVDEWASHVDVVPTVRRVCGLPLNPKCPGIALTELPREPEGRVVLSTCDGLSPAMLSGMHADPARVAPSLAGVAYSGSWKAVATGSGLSTRVERPWEAFPGAFGSKGSTDTRPADIEKKAGEALRALLRDKDDADGSEAVTRRLSAWGY